MHDLQIFVFPVYVLPFYVMRSSVGLTLSESPENQSLRPRNGKSWIFPHKILINRWVRTKIAGTNMNKGQLYKHNPSPFASAVRPACAVPRSHGRRAPLGKRVESAWERPLVRREFYLTHTFWTYSRVRVYRHTSSRCSLEGIDLLVFCVPWSC